MLRNIQIKMLKMLKSILTKDNITLLLAIWGAGLSTYKLISDSRKNIPKIKVELAYGFLTSTMMTGPTVLNIQAINMGHKSVTLNSVGLIVNNKQNILFLNPQGSVKLPYTLEEGKSCTIYRTLNDLSKDLKSHEIVGNVKIIGYYISATGKVYKSKSIKFDTEKT
jgi:hypothetical protein